MKVARNTHPLLLGVFSVNRGQLCCVFANEPSSKKKHFKISTYSKLMHARYMFTYKDIDTRI